MKFGLITDSHLGMRNDSLIFHEMALKFFETIFIPYLIEHKIKHVIHLGDVFDRRKYVNFHILESSKNRIFNKFLDLGISLDIIIGNHDTYWKNTNDVNSPELLLSNYPNIRIFKTSDNVIFGGEEFLYVPWLTDENEHLLDEKIRTSKAWCCLGHLELNGYQVQPGVYHSEGQNPSIYEKFEMVLSGHFHTRQYKDNISFLGCPYEINYTDLNEPKGFHILDTETRTIEFIQNPYKMFHRIVYDDKDKGSYNDVVKGIDFQKYEQGYIKVIVTNKTNGIWFERFLENLHSCNPTDIKIFEDYSSTFDIDIPTDVTVMSGDTLTILDNSVENLTTSFDKKMIKDVLKEVFVEAQNTEL